MSNPSYLKKDMIDYFFTQCEDKDFYICNNPKCKSKCKQQEKTGYTNLKNHLRSCIGESYESVYVGLLKTSKDKGRLDSYGFVNKREMEVYKLLQWIVMRDQPLSELDNELSRDLFRTKPISSKTMRKYILALTPLVEKAIAEDLPDTFALEFDGWTSGSVHYVALIASYVTSGIHREQLLALAPLLDEESLGAVQHIEFMESTLAIYNKSMEENVVAFIGDNCSTNRKISNDCGIPLIGCASHRFNLAVNTWLENEISFKRVLDDIHTLMVELRKLKNAARLRSLTDLCAMKNNETRWSSKYDMAKRYIQIESEVKEIEEVEEFVLTGSKRRLLDELMVHLKQFQSITKCLQKQGVSGNEVRYVFDSIVDDYPTMEHYLDRNAKIVNNPDFEVGLFKIMTKDCSSMTSAEKRATSRLKKLSPYEYYEPDSSISHEETTDGYYQQLLKRRRASTDESDQYIDCSFCVATSNTVERLFSACKHVLTDEQKCMSPIMFEALIFLKINKEFWDLTMVAKAMKNQDPRGNERDKSFYYDEG